MKMEDWKDKLKVWINIVPACLLLVVVGISLKDYEKPVYEVKEAVDIAELPKSDDETTVTDNNFDEIEIELPPTTARAGRSADATKNLKPAKDASGYKNGTYYGTGNGFAGKIKVKVVVKKGKINDIKVVESHDGASYIAAASSLLKKIVKTQSTNVDTVSGATYSSVGLIEAVRDALKDAGLTKKDKAKKNKKIDNNKKTEEDKTEEDKKEDNTFVNAKYIDGTYYGTGKGFAGDIKVRVVVQGGKITDISIEETKDGAEYIAAASALLKNIIDGQNPEVDAVSGATFSSKGLIAAVKDALKSAIATDSGTQTTEEKTTEQTKEESTSVNEKTVAIPEGKVPYKDGTYYGTGEGYKGDIKVSVTISNKTIREIVVTDTKDDEAFFSRAKSVLNSILNKQSTSVDTVSGATFSSTGLIDAVNAALLEAKKATEPENKDNTDGTKEKPKEEEKHTTEEAAKDNKDEQKAAYKDGTYTLAVLCSPDDDEDFSAYTLSVTLTFKDNNIESISDIYQVDGGEDDNSWYIDRAAKGTAKYPGIVSQIKSKGSVDGVDAVSGATCSSKAIISAVREMLNTVAAAQ